MEGRKEFEGNLRNLPLSDVFRWNCFTQTFTDWMTWTFLFNMHWRIPSHNKKGNGVCTSASAEHCGRTTKAASYVKGHPQTALSG